MTRKQRRLTLIGLAGIAAGLVLYALTDRIVFFNSPSDIAAQRPPVGSRVRLGGLVADGSVVKGNDGNVRFAVTDGSETISVDYRGILPDLFREGQGIVTEGVLAADGTFSADTVLAKHDETYMPREVVEALKRQGHWREGELPAANAATQ
jgi:cytochrome c-type biogenesis protein CcmE